ncbi:MAG TPA: MHYT domain-containing protein [Actinocrinis sp.]|nr:MHYT domain-containing protein [Actinocrinis sp.]
MPGSEGGLGWLALAYGTSCLGCLLGLSAMTRARSSDGGVRVRWLLLSAVSIGGTGIWAMHFIAMLGFNLSGAPVTFNVPITFVSLVVAVAVVGLGLTIAAAGQGDLRSLGVGGTITGLGVAAMHYLGMSAVNMGASVSYNTLIVLASVVIAVVASIVALWFAMNVRGIPATVGAAMVMGVAVTGMHYTGMAAMKMYAAPLGTREGMTADQLLAPLLGAIGVFTIVALFVAGLGPTERDLQQENEIRANIEKLEAMRQ